MKKIPNRPPEGQMVAGPPDTGGAEAGRRQNKVWSILLAILNGKYRGNID